MLAEIGDLLEIEGENPFKIRDDHEMDRRFPMKEIPPAAPRSTEDILAEIKRLYFKTTRGTIDRDFDKAIDLLKSLPTVEERQRAHVYMEGLAEMRKEWKRG